MRPMPGTVQCAAQNDLIPAAWVADGKLYPQRTVTAADFLAVLMPARPDAVRWRPPLPYQIPYRPTRVLPPAGRG